MRVTWILVLGAALLGIGWLTAPTPVRAQGPAAPQAHLPGQWEGHVAFAHGHRARVSLALTRREDGGYEGTYALTVLGEEGPETPTRGQVQVGAFDGQAVSFTLVGRPGVRAQGRLADAGSHAERALYGLFEGGAQGQGTFMVWRYRR